MKLRKEFKGITLSIGCTEDEHEFVKATVSFGMTQAPSGEQRGTMTFSFEYDDDHTKYSVTVRTEPFVGRRRGRFNKQSPEFRLTGYSKNGEDGQVSGHLHDLPWGIHWPILAAAQALNDTLDLKWVRKTVYKIS